MTYDIEAKDAENELFKADPNVERLLALATLCILKNLIGLSDTKPMEGVF